MVEDGFEIGGTMVALLVSCVVLLSLLNVLLVVVLVVLGRVLMSTARRRGLLDAVDLLHRRKRWYA